MTREAVNPETLYDSHRIYSQAIRTTEVTAVLDR